MSEEWPNGWYRDEQGRPDRPSFTPRQDAEGSSYEPTQAGPHGTAWPAQPPADSWAGDGGPASGAASSVTVDQGTSLSQLVSVAFALKNPVTTMVPFGGFGTSSAGSVVEWNVPEAKVFFNDLATDKPLPRNLITGASVAGTS